MFPLGMPERNRYRFAMTFQQDIDAIQRIETVATILNVVCRVTGMGFAAVARVTEERWICCAVRDEINFGLKPGGELKLETTICNEIRQSGQEVVIDHVAEDRHFCGHPTPAMYGFQSYVSVPIVRTDGLFFGTLCAIDPRPARLKNPQTIGMFKLFAELIALHLDVDERLASSEARLFDQERTAELREQFIAVLGHDLRNPLASIDAGARLLLKTPLNEKATAIVGMMQNSVQRMSGIINNVVDLARARMGGGLLLDRAAQRLEPVLEQVVAELRAAHPERQIAMRLALDDAINCDRIRIAQLFSNLLGNAITHGAPDQVIRAQAVTMAGTFELSVANAGPPINEVMRERLFEPFQRGTPQDKPQGLGLGLYIASQIALAHGGVLDVASAAGETRFTFRMPLR
jgi:signal transduction histidine kinase